MGKRKFKSLKFSEMKLRPSTKSKYTGDAYFEQSK